MAQNSSLEALSQEISSLSRTIESLKRQPQSEVQRAQLLTLSFDLEQLKDERKTLRRSLGLGWKEFSREEAMNPIEDRKQARNLKLLDQLEDAREEYKNYLVVRRVGTTLLSVGTVLTIVWPILLAVLSGMHYDWGEGSGPSIMAFIAVGIAGIFFMWMAEDEHGKARKNLRIAERAYRDFINEG